MLARAAEEMVESGTIPEFDWSKIREMEFQEQSKEKSNLLSQLSRFQCTRCPDLVEHVNFLTTCPGLTDLVSSMQWHTRKVNLKGSLLTWLTLSRIRIWNYCQII